MQTAEASPGAAAQVAVWVAAEFAGVSDPVAEIYGPALTAGQALVESAIDLADGGADPQRQWREGGGLDCDDVDILAAAATMLPTIGPS